jgi:hypothetical protein
MNRPIQMPEPNPDSLRPVLSCGIRRLTSRVLPSAGVAYISINEPAIPQPRIGSIARMNWGLVLICLVAFLPVYELVRAIRAWMRRERFRVVVTEFGAAGLFGLLAFLVFLYLRNVGVLAHLF